MKSVELAPSGFDVKSFPRQSRSRGGGIATVCKSTLSSSITFKTNFDFTHTSFEVVQALITLLQNTLHFFCLYCPPTSRRSNLTDSMFTEQLPDLLDYVNNLQGFACPVDDMNIHFDNPLQSLTKHTLTTLILHNFVHVINKPTHMFGNIIDLVVVRPDDDIHKTSIDTDSLESDHYCIKSYFNVQSLSLLPYAGQLGTWLTLTDHHLLLNFPVYQSFHLLKRRTGTVTLCALH